MVDKLSEVPAYEADKSFYSDWGDPREYSIGDMGVGECAGEVVPYVIMRSPRPVRVSGADGAGGRNGAPPRLSAISPPRAA
jgi:hypothetical protein